ncbi:uncharacterized protein DDB_G0284459-like [Asterias rubens]|uniref:uncharacterized protein DDB_G0284459-like n=1 Tax=Asterias rubens TaxID=7604 RepID=UPI0014559C63|nr:uncharacterized protein DDB_G0284459-like [Asterias rubens]
MFAQRKSHLRAVSSSTAGLNTLSTPSSASPGRRVQSWVYGERDPASRPGRPVRSFSAESLHVIPQTKDINSQFQTVLGKCLFDQAVQGAEDGGQQSPVATRGMTPMPGSGSPGSSRPASSQGSTGTNSPLMDTSRTTIRLRPTRCTSPLVKGSRSFDSYINNGSLDQVAIAKARGPLEPPKPCIYKYIHRVKTASNNNLNDFSLKSEFTDSLRESEREKYWKGKVEEKIIEEEMNERKEREKAEMMIILEDMKKEYVVRKAKEEAELRKKQEELDRIAKEKEEKEALMAASIANQCIADDTLSVISSSSKSSKKRSSKKGGRSKKDKNSKKGKSSSKKSAKKRASVSPSRDESNQGSGRNTPQPILKSDGRRQSSAEQSENSSGTGKTKRVTFRKNLVSSKTFKSSKPVSPKKISPKKSFPGSAGSESRSSSPTRGDKKSRSSSPKGKRTRGKGSKKGTKKKSTVDAEPQVEPPQEPEQVPEPVEPETTLEPEEPKEPVVIVVDEPPEFIPAVDYKTRNQMVEEWLYYRTSSANRKANPPIL